MATTHPESSAAPAVADDIARLDSDGITARKGAFSAAWADQLREDMMTAFWAAIQRPGGAVGRGPRRWYVEVHPEDISGFVDLATHRSGLPRLPGCSRDPAAIRESGPLLRSSS